MINFFHEHVVRTGEETHVVIEGLVDHERFAGFGVRGDTEDAIQIAGFVIQREGQLIPIEVKSADNTRAKSLKIYMDSYKPAYAIKLSAKNFGMENNLKIVPLYAAFCI